MMHARAVNPLIRRATVAACLFTGLGALPRAQAQCQTWSLEPLFQPTVVSGNYLNICTVWDSGSGPELWVGGEEIFTSNGLWNVGRWNGHQWIPTGVLTESVRALCPYDSGSGLQMHAGGSFEIGNVRGIARWTGADWQLLGSGLVNPTQTSPANVQALAVFDSGQGPELYCGGGFNGAPGVASKGIIRWNGTSWSPVGSGLGAEAGYPYPFITKFAVYDAGQGPALYVAGFFGSAGGQPIHWLAKWDGTTWSSLGSGINGEVLKLNVLDDGSGSKLYVGGTMTIAGGVPVNSVAVWDGSSWSGFPSPPGSPAVPKLVYDDGTGPAIYCYTNLVTIDGVRTRTLVRYDGQQWSELGGGINGTVHDFTTYDDGSGHGPDLYAVGQFGSAGGGITSWKIARWKRCAGPIDAICPGDHSLVKCPCMNLGAAGRGCENSAGSGGAKLEWSGTTTPDALQLTSSGEPSGSLSIFLQGSAPTNATLPFGDGLRCAGGNLKRLYVTNATGGTAMAPAAGQPSISTRSSELGDPLFPGAVRLYQVYYRDPVSPCGQLFNASNGVRAVW